MLAGKLFQMGGPATADVSDVSDAVFRRTQLRTSTSLITGLDTVYMHSMHCVVY